MIWFWIAAAFLSAVLAALIVQRSAAKAGAAEAAAEKPALAVYRRQMAEVDQLAERGLLDEREHRSIRAETGRRLLAAADRKEAPLRASPPAIVLSLAAAIPLAALGVYLVIGAPDFADQPIAQRLAKWRAADPATLTPPQMAALLRQIAAERPNDPEPLAQLARAELAAGAPTEAVQALQRAIALAPRRGDLWEMLGEVLTLQSDGDVKADAAADFRQALALDPTAAGPRYFLARAKIASGDVAGGLGDWRALALSLAPGDPRRAQLSAEIGQVEASGHLPTGAPAGAGGGGVGPPQIQAMVDSLAARLQAQPDDPAGWVRLVRAYAVLGETDRLQSALAEARRRFAARKDVLAALAAASAPPQTAGGAVSSPAGSP